MADEKNNDSTGASAGTKNEDSVANANDFVLSDQVVTKNDNDGVGVLFGTEAGTVEQTGEASDAASSSESELGASEANATSASSNTDSLSNDDLLQSNGNTSGLADQIDTSGPAVTNSDATTGENSEIVGQNTLSDVDIVEATGVTGPSDAAPQTGNSSNGSSAEAEAESDEETSETSTTPTSLDTASQSSNDVEQSVPEVTDAPTLETPEEPVNATAAPVDIQFSNRAVDENSAGGTVIGTLSASDADSNEFSYQLVDSEGTPVENDLFEIVGNQIVVRAGADIDFETQATHDLSLQVTDESGNTFIEAFEIDVNNQAEGISGLTFNFAENSGVKAEFFVFDGDNNVERDTRNLNNVDFDRAADSVQVVEDLNFGSGDNTVFENDAGRDDHFAARFTTEITVDENGEWTFGVNADDGVRILVNGELVVEDVEAHDARFVEGGIELEAGTHTLEVFYFENRFDTTLDVVWKGPNDDDFEQLDSSQFAFSNQAVFENAEAGTVVGTLNVEGAIDRFEITEGASDLFEIANGNQIVVKEGADIDFETAQSFPIEVTAFAANGETLTTNINIDVQDINEDPTDIFFDGDFSVDESGSGDRIVARITGAEDQDANESFSYSIVGEHADTFFVDADNNIAVIPGVELNAEEIPSLDIDVQVADKGGLIHVETVTVSVAEVSETDEPVEVPVIVPETSNAPFDITFSATSIDENSEAGSVLATLTSRDADQGDTFTYELSGPGAEFFEVLDDQIVVREGADLNAEALSSVQLTVTTTDSQGNSFSEAASIRINNLNEGFTTVTPDNTSIDENTGVNEIVANLTTDNPDAGDFVSFEIVGGSDEFFTLGNRIRVKAGADLDHEGQPEHTLTIRATDRAGNTAESEITINLNDINEAPTAVVAAPEVLNSSDADAGTVVANLTVADVDDGDTHTFELSGLGAENFEVVDGQVVVAEGA
ncbi:MAG: PA14 domain-containing protein, partial [Hyphomicrobiales bacterium]